MGNLCKVGHVDFVRNGLTQSDGQFHLGFLEFLGIQYALHRHDVGFLVRNFNADSALARHRSNDTDAQSRQIQGDVFLQILYSRYADALSRSDFIKRYGWTNGSLDFFDGHAKRIKDLNDALVVGLNLFHVDFGLARIVILFQ